MLFISCSVLVIPQNLLCVPSGESSLTVLTFAKNMNCPKKMFRKPGAVTIEGGIMGLGDSFSMKIRIAEKTAEIVNKDGLLPSRAGLPLVVPRTNEVAEMTKAPSPR